jgi:hypothetical protein
VARSSDHHLRRKYDVHQAQHCDISHENSSPTTIHMDSSCQCNYRCYLVDSHIFLHCLPVHTSPSTMGLHHPRQTLYIKRVFRFCSVLSLSHVHSHRLAVCSTPDPHDLVYSNVHTKENYCRFPSRIRSLVCQIPQLPPQCF